MELTDTTLNQSKANSEETVEHHPMQEEEELTDVSGVAKDRKRKRR